MVKKVLQNIQNKVFCDRKTFSRHLGLSTSRIRANILLVEETINLQNTYYYLLNIFQEFWLVNSCRWKRHIRLVVAQMSGFDFTVVNWKQIYDMSYYRDKPRPRQITQTSKPKAEADNTNRGLNNSSYPARTDFNNCFIIFWLLFFVLLFVLLYFKLSLNACFVIKNTHAANNGTAWNCSETLISQSDQEKIFLQQFWDYKVSQYTTKLLIMSYIYFQLQIWQSPSGYDDFTLGS